MNTVRRSLCPEGHAHLRDWDESWAGAQGSRVCSGLDAGKKQGSFVGHLLNLLEGEDEVRLEMWVGSSSPRLGEGTLGALWFAQ